MGCLLRTTLSTILLTNIVSHQIYIIYQAHQFKNNFIRWIAIKDNTCQQSHVFIFIQWVAIKDNTLHHISNNLPLWTWWQPRWCLVTTTDRYHVTLPNMSLTSLSSLHSNTMSLSPFDIKGKGRMKTNTLPLFSSCGRNILQIWYVLKWPSSPWVHAES